MKYEDIINDKNINFKDKIPTLISIWEQLKRLIQNPASRYSVDKLLDWAQRNTLNFVLHGDWAKQPETLKNHVAKIIEEFNEILSRQGHVTSRRCKKLVEVVKNPWNDETLTKILNHPETCTKEEELTYFSSEHGYLVAMRLKKLCESRCEDLALRFANACLRCLRLPESQHYLVVTTEDQHRYILDIYIALLHKFKRTHDIISELKHINLDEGLQLVNRFSKKKIECSRIWKHSTRIAELAAQFFMTAAMTKPINEIKIVLIELLNSWVLLSDKLESLETIPSVMRKIIQTADSAAHIYICCEVLSKKFGEKFKLFTIELYVRALTTDMNEMEKQKTRSEIDKVQETSKRLSEGFLSLADLLHDHLGVSRECVLTSFSLNPTRACFERIEKLAIACGKAPDPIKNDSIAKVDTSEFTMDLNLPLLDTGQNSQSSSNHPTPNIIVKSKQNDCTLDALILIKGDAVTGSKDYDVLSAPSQVLDAEALGLSKQLCDDLAVVLSSPRYQLLSWVLDWKELKNTCDKYLSNAESRNSVKELKYLNIDYNQFKDWPMDDARHQYGGIEKGYEQWAEENSNDSVEYSLLYSQGNDSDCSSTAGNGRRRRKTARRIYSSESEYDSVERKVDSHSSDIDTASQDADSLGSDGLQQNYKVPKKRGRPPKSATALPRFAVIMNGHNQDNIPSTNYNNDNMLSIFARLDEKTGKQLTISKPSYANPQLQQLILPEKRSSDPKVLKNLRMFRAKKRLSDDIDEIKNSTDNNADLMPSSTDTKLAKLTTMPNMNPRVLLDRHDFNNYSNNCTLNHQTVKQTLRNLVKKRNMEKSENKPIDCNDVSSKVNMNPCVILDRYDDIQNLYNTNKHSLNHKHILSDSFRDRKKRKFDVLADVPGLNTLDMIQPVVMEQTIQVVQLSTNQIGNQQMRAIKTQTSNNTNSVTSTISSSTNSITSTPVTAHIQRVGQPRPQQDNNQANKIICSDAETSTNKSENTSSVPVTLQNTINSSSSSEERTSSSSIVNTSSSMTTNSTESTSSTSATENTASKTSTSESSQSSSHLVNILSHQIIRPAQTTTTPVRNPAPINILSQQIIRPPISSHSVPIVCVSTSGLQTTVASNTTSVTTTVTQAQNSVKLVSTNTQHPMLQQMFNSQRKINNQVIKNVNLVTGLTSNTQTTVDANKLVQFLYKTTGKMIHLTPYPTNSNIKVQTIDSSKLLKAGTTITTVPSTTTSSTVSIPISPISPPISTRSMYEENYAKFIQTTGKPQSKNVMKEATTVSETTTTEQANSLPKFQQAFGKAVYQSSADPTSAAALPTVGINNNTVNVSLHGGSLVTSTQTNVTSANVNSITVNPQHIQLTTSTIKTTSNPPTVTAVATIPVQVGTASKTTVSPLGVQTIQGGVIYTRQVPVSLAVTAGQTINLISNTNVAQAGIGRNQVFRITSATGEQIKDTVIRSKMSALLAAALQSGVSNRSVASNVVSGMTTTTTTVTSPSQNTESTIVYSQNQQETTIVESDACEVDSSSNDSSSQTSASTSTTSTLVTPMRITLPMIQRTPGPNGLQGTRIVRPVLQIPGSMIRGAGNVRQQVVLASAQSLPIASSSARTLQTQSVSISENLVTPNSIEPMVSSTTLEQLREFDLVLEQVKERSTVQPASGPAATRAQGQNQNQADQTEKSTTTTTTNAVSQSSELQEVISNVSVSYLNQSQLKQTVSPCTSVVVVTSYCNIQPAASPALSVTSQSSSSPCVTPAPSSSGSIGKTVPKTTGKSPKSKTVKTTTTHTSKASPVPKPQQKPQEDEQTTQRIFDILAEYAEQLRNSPDLNNKPAPRRRSNPPTNPSQNSKRKKSSGAKKTATSHCNSMNSDLSPGADDPRTIGSEDSSCGVVQISVQDSPSQGAPSTEDHQSTQGSSDFSSLRTQQTESSDGATETIENQLSTSGRQFIFTDSNTNQSRNVIIADSTVNEALGKISNNTATVIVPANYIAVVSGNNKILATVPTRSNQMLLFQSFLNQSRKPTSVQSNVKGIKYSTIHPLQSLSTQNLSAQQVVIPSGSDDTALTQTLTIKNSNSDNSTTSDNEGIQTTGDLLLNVGTSNSITPVSTQQSTEGNITKMNANKTTPLATTVENGVESVVTQVLPLCSESMLPDNREEKSSKKSDENNSVSNASFSLNFVTKSSTSVLNQVTRSPVIEKSINTSDTNATKNISNTGLPTLGEKSTIVRTIIENQTSDNNIVTFSEIECTTSVDRFNKGIYKQQ